VINTRIRSGALLVGIGLGGLADGIVFRELLQWNSMLSSTLVQDSVAALRVSMAADGMFHLVAWLIGLAGILTIWSAFGKPGTLPATRVFAGYLLIGWGWFNLVEGIVNHHFLALHHVRDLPEHVPAYDWIYLLVGGLGFIALGMLLARKKAVRQLPERRAGYERRGTGDIVRQ
jgi:uncharacterized membrane protein